MIVVQLADASEELQADYAHLREPSRRATIEKARGCFVIEGLFALEAAVASRYPLRSVLCDRAHLDQTRETLAALGAPDDLTVLVASGDQLRELAGFAFHRGVLAAADRVPFDEIGEIVAGARRVLIVEGVVDHENLGALFRNAAAFGVDGVVLGAGTADPLYRRVVRVSVGNVLRVPIATAHDWPGDITTVREAGAVVVALTPDGELTLDELAAEPPPRLALLVGAEGSGLTPAARAAADQTVRIPMHGGVDSLNVATATAVALYALSRPR